MSRFNIQVVSRGSQIRKHLLKTFYGVNIPDEVTELLHVIDKLLDGIISVTELGENNAVKTLKKRIQAFNGGCINTFQ
jgi:hypothetical protein